MTDLGNHNFNSAGQAGLRPTDAPGAAAASAAKTAPDDREATSDCARLPTGVVLEVSGTGSQLPIYLATLTDCHEDGDHLLQQSGQVSRPIRHRVGSGLKGVAEGQRGSDSVNLRR